jgi:hypothetical protein
MSDAYEKSHDHRVVLKPERQGVPPTIKLDPSYKFVDALLVRAQHWPAPKTQP